MSSGSMNPIPTTTFDLYDFFSMLLPGGTLILGLLPFAPRSVQTEPFGAVVVFFIGSYVLGRGLHSAAESVDKLSNTPSHRTLFKSELQSSSPDLISESTVDAFYDAAIDHIQVPNYPADRTSATDEMLDVLYVHTRSYIHMDGTGRSRTFQAVFAFYRSADLVIMILVAVYFFYGVGGYLHLFSNMGDYSSFVGSLGLPPSMFLIFSEILLGATALTFHDAKGDYREYFIQYLFIDFLILEGS